MNMKLPKEDAPLATSSYSDDEDNVVFVTPPIRDGDFSEYMWMENEDEFDSEVIRQLEEEELMEQCMHDMRSDEVSDNIVNAMASVNITGQVADSITAGTSQSVNELPSNPSARSTRSQPRYSAMSRLERIRQETAIANGRSGSIAIENNHAIQQNGGIPRIVDGCTDEPRNGLLSGLNPNAKEFVPGQSSARLHNGDVC